MLQDTHYYDGKMGELINELKEDIIRASNISKETKTNAFKIMLNDAQFKISLHTIIARHIQPQSRLTQGNLNYDQLNGLFACDMLWLIYEKIYLEHNKDYVDLLEIAYQDMQTGLCAQGICTRLFQILIMMKESIGINKNDK